MSEQVLTAESLPLDILELEAFRCTLAGHVQDASSVSVSQIGRSSKGHDVEHASRCRWLKKSVSQHETTSSRSLLVRNGTEWRRRAKGQGWKVTSIVNNRRKTVAKIPIVILRLLRYVVAVAFATCHSTDETWTSAPASTDNTDNSNDQEAPFNHVQ